MRAVVISDVHGEYDKMIAALDAVQFDKEKDMLISNGDLIDRGPKVMECIRYVLSCPHHFIILGNHEYMFLETLLEPTKSFTMNDYWNGEGATLKSIFNIEISRTENQKFGFSQLYWGAPSKEGGGWEWMEMIDRNTNLNSVYKHADQAALTNLKDFFSYIRQGYKFIKLYDSTTGYFITHGWPSVNINDELDEFMMSENEISASWILTSDCMRSFFMNELDKEDKIKKPVITFSANNATIIVGHEWAFRLRYINQLIKEEHKGFTNDKEYWSAIRGAVSFNNFDTFSFEVDCVDSNHHPSHNRIVMIDGCANAELGKVNAFCIDDVDGIECGESVVAQNLNTELKYSDYAELRKLAK